VSLTQWKPDYEGAAPLFEQAGAALRAATGAHDATAKR
jgi:hypothetical protein